MASGRQSGSVVWSYFEFDESNNKVHCKKFKQELAFNRNINAMREHLKRKHVYVNLQKNDESLPVGLSSYYNCHFDAHEHVHIDIAITRSQRGVIKA